MTTAELDAVTKLVEESREEMELACQCAECGADGVRYFTTEGDGPFWLCDRIRVGENAKGTHAMPERYAGEEVLAPKRPFDGVRIALAALDRLGIP